MDQFIKREPYDYLGKKTIELHSDRIVINSKNLVRSMSDDWSYSLINPEFRTIRRGEKEWGNVIYGLIITVIVFFLLIKGVNIGLFTLIAYGIQLTCMISAGYFVFLGFFKRNFVYVLDKTGDPIFALKETPEAKEFLKKLKTHIEQAKPAS
jgi:hypothetical protein